MDKLYILCNESDKLPKEIFFWVYIQLLIEELELKLRAMVKQKLSPGFLPSIWTEKSNYKIAH
jgi:hypothetical protein